MTRVARCRRADVRYALALGCSAVVAAGATANCLSVVNFEAELPAAGCGVAAIAFVRAIDM